MNRELKFRAWNNREKVMLYFPNFVYLINKDGSFGGEPLTYLQFTGLKDSKGNEIYEGDIISTERIITINKNQNKLVNLIAEVRFGRFEASDDEYYSVNIGWYLESKFGTFSLIQHIECENEVEIIGNIFQNSELLTQ